MVTSHEGLPRPRVTLTDAVRWATEHWGVGGDARELGSQQDRNLLLTSESGRFLLKVSNAATTRAEVEAQGIAMHAVADTGLAAPLPLACTAGGDVVEVDIEGVVHLVRLLTFVEGTPLIDAGHLSTAAIIQLGETAARVSRSLATVEHPGLDRAFQWDLRRGEEVVRTLAHHVTDPVRRADLEEAVARLSQRLLALTPRFPVQALHADLTDNNVVTHRDRAGGLVVDGIIDFGDVSLGWRVAELAVTCTAVFHHHPTDPFAVLPLIRAFHDRCPLEDAEVEALWSLIVLRGAVLVVSGGQQAAVDPTNGYAVSALEREWLTFSVPAAVDAAVATAAIRRALGLPGVPPSRPLGAGTLLAAGPTPAMVDLSSSSRSLADGCWLQDGPAEEHRVLSLAAGPAGRSVTRFGEPRLTRSRSHDRSQPRNIAMAVDVHAPGDHLVAPFEGTVSRVGDAVVLRGVTHTVVLEGLDSGVHGPIRAGERLGSISGTVRVWLTHDLDPTGTPPPFVTTVEQSGWESFLLDPAPLLGLDTTRAPDIATSGVLERRQRSYSTLQSHYYESPPRIERGWREHLVDTRGRHHLDMVNNVTVLGHGHPRIARAAADQWRMLNTNSRFNYGGVADLSERLLSTLPEPFDTVLLVNSGSEAVDLALRLTRAFTGREDVLCLTESYHGWTLASDAVSTSLSDNPAAGIRPGWVHVTTTPNTYRGPHRGAGAGAAYAAEAVAMVDGLARGGCPVGTFIAEPRQGNAGAIEVPDGYLARVYDAVRSSGGVCISDEVQVGYGRQGDVFWGYEQHPGLVPDVITVAKAMGNGHPLGAVITRREIAESLADQGTFFSSAGGSTLSCRIGVEVFDTIVEEGLQANAAAVGTHLSAALADLARRHPLVGAVHGRGLYQGVELVRDPVTLEPATEEAAALCDRMLELGVVVQPTGDRQNILKVKPPMCFTEESADYFAAVLDEVLTSGW